VPRTGDERADVLDAAGVLSERSPSDEATRRVLELTTHRAVVAVIPPLSGGVLVVPAEVAVGVEREALGGAPENLEPRNPRRAEIMRPTAMAYSRSFVGARIPLMSGSPKSRGRDPDYPVTPGRAPLHSSPHRRPGTAGRQRRDPMRGICVGRIFVTAEARAPRARTERTCALAPRRDARRRGCL
jgi:hypothetical protein